MIAAAVISAIVRISLVHGALISLEGAMQISFIPLERVEKDSCRSFPPAEYRIAVHPAIFPLQILQMRHQIVVENLRRTVAQTSAVRQQTEFLMVRIRPADDLAQGVHVVIDIALDAEAVEPFRRIIQRFDRPDLHIDRRPDFQLRKMFLEEFRDEPGCRRDRIQADSIQQVFRISSQA